MKRAHLHPDRRRRRLAGGNSLGHDAQRAARAVEVLEGRLLLSSISGKAWNDADGDRAIDAGEGVLSGWTVYLDQNRNALRDPTEATTTTDNSGNYTFANLPAGKYYVAINPRGGWEQTSPAAPGWTGLTPTSARPAVTTLTNSDAPAFTNGAEPAELPRPRGGTGTPASADGNPPAPQPTTAQASTLIRLNQARADARLAGVSGQGLAVAVLDTGIDLDHPTFGPDADGNGVADRIVYQYDFANDDTDASDRNGHGSNVTSIAAGEHPDHLGMAPAADIVALKVFPDSGEGTFGDIERALQWVIANASAYRIAAVNMSLGDGANFSAAQSMYGLGDELAALAAQNVIVVTSAGNDYYKFAAQGVSYPAADPNALAAGAVYDSNIGEASYFGGAQDFTTGADRVASFSQRSTSLLDVFAPGAQMFGASADGGTTVFSGTSQASPAVAGTAVLAQQLALRHLGRRLSPAEFRTLMRDNAASIYDGDDENDNVPNTNASYKRLDVFALEQAIYNLGGDYLAGAAVVTLGAGESRTGVNFGARLLPLNPGLPNLVASSDTGLSDDDDLTNLDNSATDRRLYFAVPNTVAGVTVQILADGVVIGSTAGLDRSTTVATNGAADLADGTHTITARMIPSGGGAASPQSAGLAITVDTAAPAPLSTFALRGASDTGVSAADRLTKDRTPTFDVAGAAYYRVYRDGGAVSGLYETGSSFTDQRVVGDGAYRYEAEARDAAGNFSTISAAVNVTVDTAGYPFGPFFDGAFGTNGRSLFTSPVADTGEYIGDIAVQPDGKVVVVGYYEDRTTIPGDTVDRGWMITRLNANGSVDTSFANNGWRTLNPGYVDELHSVAIQPDGKILAGGGVGEQTSTGGNFTRFALWRLNADGSPDASFGTNGVLVDRTTNANNGFRNGFSNLTILPNGKILAAGQGVLNSSFNYAVAKYLPNGQRDTSFGTANGIAWIDFGWYDELSGMAVMPDGKIVLTGTGYPTNTSPREARTARLLPDGKLDTTFDGDGLRYDRFTHLGSDFITNAITAMPDGDIVIGGQVWVPDNGLGHGNFWDGFLARLNPDGSLDAGFGDGGAARTPLGGHRGEIWAVQARDDGRLVAVATSGNYTGMLVAAFQPDGTPDSSLVAGGVDRYAVSSTQFGAVALQPDGKVLVASHVSPTVGNQSGLLVARLTRQAPADALTLDPASDTGPSNSDRITSNTTPTFNVPATPAGYNYRIYRNGTLISGPYASGASFTAPPQAAGTTAAYAYTFVDAAGNESGRSLPVSVTVVNDGSQPGQPVTLRATADAHVRDGTYAGQNFGTAAELHLKKSTFAGSSREVYLKFDLSGVASVSAATLRLWGRIDSATEAPAVAVYPVGNTSWSENTLTWNNRPAAGAAALATTTVAGSVGKWYEWDVTSYLVAEKAAGRNTVTLAVRTLATTNPYLIFASDEAAANPPQLVVTPASNPGPAQSLVVSPTNLAVPEGGTASATVRLAAQPTSDVVVSVARQSGDSDLNAAPATLTFTPANWNAPQSVTWSAAQDADTTNGSATFNISSAGLATVAVTATEQDDDGGTATPVTLRALSDAYVRDGSYAGQNFGTTTELQLKHSTFAGSSREMYLKFDLSGAASVGNAKLRLWGRIDSATETPPVAVYPAGSTSWTEGGLTWNNRPAAGATALATATVATNTAKWYEWDVTGYLAAEKAAGRNTVTLVVRALATTTPYLIFSSDEAGANRPELVVTPAGNPPPPPAQAIVVSTDQLAVPEGGGAPVTVKLAAEPAGNVTVAVNRSGGTSDDPDLTTLTDLLTFTPANWNVAQAVTINAAEDADTTSGSALFSLSSTGLAPKTVLATEVDNDTPPTGPTVLRATADAYVRDGSTHAGQNFGSAPQLQVKQAGTGWYRESYLRFDLSQLAGTVNSAKLRLFGKLDNSQSASVAFNVFTAGDASWTESGVTFNTRPAGVSNTAVASGSVTGTTGQWYELDLTSLLQSEKAKGSTAVTLVLRAAVSSNATILFDSDEGTNRPELVVG